MTRTQITETVITAAVLVLGYNMITSLMAIFTTILFGIGIGVDGTFKNIILPYLIYLAFYAIVFFLLARNVRPLARFISRGSNETIALKLNKSAVLQIVIIAVCIITLIQAIPELIQYIFYLLQPLEDYEGSAYNGRRNVVNNFDLWKWVASLVVTIALVITSKKIAAFFGEEERITESETEKLENDN